MLTPQDEAELKQMIKVYPYFQALYVLYAKANNASENIEKAAVRTLDRDLLRKIITKNFNPNETDSFANLLKNTEQVNAFEKLKVKEEETSIANKTQPEEITETTIIFDDIDESAASIVLNEENDFTTSFKTTDTDNFFEETTLNTEENLFDKNEPVYNPFASDIFDKELSTTEIAIDEDVKLQTPLDYDDDLVKPLSEYETEEKIENIALQPQNYIISTDNFFEEAILQAESEKEDSKNIEAEKIENFFEVPDFEEIDKPLELNTVNQDVKNNIPQNIVNEENESEWTDNQDFNKEKLESSFFDLSDDLMKPTTEKISSEQFAVSTENQVVEIENKLEFLDTYYLRKEEEGQEIHKLAHEIISNEVAHNEVLMGDAVLSITDKIALLDAYYLRKEEETLGTDTLNHEIISNEVAHNEVLMGDAVLSITDKIELLDAYYLRKEEETLGTDTLNHEIISNEVAHNEVFADFTILSASTKIELLDAYYLRKEEEVSDEPLPISNETVVITENKLDLLDTYYLRKEEEVSDEPLPTSNETPVITENKLDLLDNYYLRKEEEVSDEPLPISNETVVITENKLDLLDNYYLRKEEEVSDEPLPTSNETPVITENKLDLLDTYYLRKEGEVSNEQLVVNSKQIQVSNDDNIDFFTQLTDKEDLKAVEEVDFLKKNEVQFFDIPNEEIFNSFGIEEVDTEFDTTNFFDDHQHEPTHLTTASKPIYKKASQEYQRNLIDRFIKESPSIQIDRSKLSDDFIDLAEESTKDNLEVASEYLAKIYAKQGNKEKAIEVYQRLVLKNPERGHYFTSQIEILMNS